MITLEICTGSLESIHEARKGGADRVEVCTALEVGGLTPSAGHIAEALKIEGIRKNVLIRPRTGDFCYNDVEQQTILHDIRLCREMGADGVVVGALLPDGTLDINALKAYRKAAEGLYLTFHRAFDVCSNPDDALFQLIDLGFDCILTSGQRPCAHEGVDLLRRLINESCGRICIMPGSGVSPANAHAIIEATGANAIHASAQEKTTLLHDTPFFPGSFGTTASIVAKIKAELTK